MLGKHGKLVDNPCRRIRPGRGSGRGLTTNLSTLSARADRPKCRPSAAAMNKVSAASGRRGLDRHPVCAAQGWRDLQRRWRPRRACGRRRRRPPCAAFPPSAADRRRASSPCCGSRPRARLDAKPAGAPGGLRRSSASRASVRCPARRAQAPRERRPTLRRSGRARASPRPASRWSPRPRESNVITGLPA